MQKGLGSFAPKNKEKEGKNINKIYEKIKELREGALGILYPHVCPFCQRVTAEEVCRECKAKLPYVKGPRCMKCGKPIEREDEEYCRSCARTRHAYERGCALWLHDGVVKASVYRFKYQNQRIYARYYAKELVKKYGEAIRGFGIGLIIPIPLYRKKRKERGYNQAQVLAREVAGLLQLPLDASHLVRVRPTVPQKNLNAGGRKQNLRGAFAVKPGFRFRGRVLLIDDIYTTGSTIDSAAAALKAAGVKKVYFLTISIGQG